MKYGDTVTSHSIRMAQARVEALERILSFRPVGDWEEIHALANHLHPVYEARAIMLESKKENPAP